MPGNATVTTTQLRTSPKTRAITLPTLAAFALAAGVLHAQDATGLSSASANNTRAMARMNIKVNPASLLAISLKIGLAALLAMNNVAQAQSSNTPARSDSNGIRTSYSTCLKTADGVTPDMQACIGNEYAYQDKRLNRVYKSLMARLSKDEQAKLRDEERKWIAHRDAYCAPPPDAGQGQRLDSNDCAMEETAKRATALEAHQPTD